MNHKVGLILLLLAFNGVLWFVFTEKPTEALVKLPPSAITNVADSKRPTPAVVVVQTNTFSWEQLEAEDYATYIERLRKIGCPEQTIRDIIIADLEKLMAPRVQEINGQKEPPKYWKPDRKELVRTVDLLDQSSRKQELDFEKREIIRELLGIDLAAERSKSVGESDIYEERLGFLTPDKRSRVRMIIERANREEVALREKAWLDSDSLGQEERKQLREIAAKKEREVTAVLTPEEAEQYQLWFSDAAYTVRDSFFAMEPSEEDFLAIYKLQREFDSQWKDKDIETLSALENAQLQQAKQEYEEKIHSYLGDDRYREYRRSRDADYQQLQAAAAQFGLNGGVASEVYGFKKILQEERERVRQMPGLSPEQRARVNQALADEAEHAIIEVMGQKPYRYYIRSGAGKWIWE